MNISPHQCRASSLGLASTLISMAESCASMRDLKPIHARSIRSFLHLHTIVFAKMLRFAAVSPTGDLDYAHRLFAQMPQPKSFFYNTLIRGYSKSPTPIQSLSLFNQMRRNCIEPDEFTLTFLLKAQSRTMTNTQSPSILSDIHGVVVKAGFSSHLFVQNALIHFYAAAGSTTAAWLVFNETEDADVVSWSGLVLSYIKAGELDLARRVFDEMPEKDVVTWTAIISGYSRARRSEEALDLFWEMTDAGIDPDEVTMVSVISACTDLGDIKTGTIVHQFIDEHGFGWMVSLCNALISMYAKCGYLEGAWGVFNSMARRSLTTWNSIISACANHGDVEYAFRLFDYMLKSGVRPDGVTFLLLLVGYTHEGRVEDGWRLFESMQRDYGVEARVEHYGCMVDMLGKAGRLEEAYEFIVSMPIPGNDKIWGALLSACRVYRDADLAKRVLRKLLQLKPNEGGCDLLLGDVYVASGEQEEATKTS